jgi:hypothetical protein
LAPVFWRRNTLANFMPDFNYRLILGKPLSEKQVNFSRLFFLLPNFCTDAKNLTSYFLFVQKAH